MTNMNMTIDTEALASVPTQVTPKSPASKVIVAQSDYERALQAMDDVMKNEFYSQPSETTTTTTTTSVNESRDDDETMEDTTMEETGGAGDENNQNDDASIGNNKENNKEKDDVHDTEAQEQQKQATVKNTFLAQVHNSLKERLNQIVQPIPDEEFHKRARGPMLQQQIEDETEDEQILLEQEDAARQAEEQGLRAQEEMHGMDCNTDYDEHELLDQDAVKRARELRRQVRTMASDMKQRQDAILERAIQLAQREVRLLTEDILLKSMSDDSEDEKDATHRESHDARRLMLQQMKVSLQALMTSLSSTVEGELPTNLRDLQDTIDNIEKSLHKKQQPESLSQTEQAILSRTNEGGLCSVAENSKDDLDGPSTIEEEDGFNDMSNPYVFLADFLGRY